MTQRFSHTDLIERTADLFAKAGLARDIAQVTAEVLVEADLLGYDTHGLQFVPAYLKGIETGRTTLSGEPEVLKDGGRTVLLDGHRLPGQWATVKALELARERVSGQGTVSVVLRGVQNISCLAVYARRAALDGLLTLVMASAPGNAAVAPHGGREGRLSTNPLAVGIPLPKGMILIDTSSSATSNRQVERHRRAGTSLPRPSLVGSDGHPSDDPETLFADSPGAILPGGGVDYGHKGFALGLLVEAFTSGLAGGGRSDEAPGAGNTVFLQLTDPEAFGGRDAFTRETGFLAEACRDTPPLDGGPPVRVPGDRALAHFEKQVAEGVTLHPEIMPLIAPLFEKHGVPPPEAL